MATQVAGGAHAITEGSVTDDRSAARRGYDPLAIGAERRTVQPLGIAFQGSELFAGRRIPGALGPALAVSGHVKLQGSWPCQNARSAIKTGHERQILIRHNLQVGGAGQRCGERI
jgi:hypothetical protein